MLRLVIGILIGAGVGTMTGYFGKCSSGSCPLTATPVRGAVYGGVVGLFIALTMGTPGSCGPSVRRETSRDSNTTTAPSRAVTTVAGHSEGKPGNAPMHISEAEDFEARVLRSDMPCLVDFYSEHCPPCRMLGPTIEKLAERYEGRAVVAKVNLDRGRNGDLARRYDIRGIPAVLFFSKGRQEERLVGLRDESEYVAVLDRLAPKATTSPERHPEPDSATPTLPGAP